MNQEQQRPIMGTRPPQAGIQQQQRPLGSIRPVNVVGGGGTVNIMFILHKLTQLLYSTYTTHNARTAYETAYTTRCETTYAASDAWYTSSNFTSTIEALDTT